MKAIIITIGDEILIGQVIDTNSAWIGDTLSQYGVDVIEKITITDEDSHIINTLKYASSKADLVLMTGGLGPTKDDVTKKSLANYYGVEMVFSDSTKEWIKKIYANFNIEFRDSHNEQCFMPSNAQLLHNAVGTAPGMLFEEEETLVLSMPGVPFEMKSIITQQFLPLLTKRGQQLNFYHKTIMTAGMGESSLATKIEDITDAFEDDISIAFLPSLGSVRLRVTGKSPNDRQIEKRVQGHVDKLVERIPDLVFGFDNLKIENHLLDLFTTYNLKLATAESCTGGYLSHKITSVPGSSSYFLGGIVSYSNEMKMKILGVQKDTLENFGAVSKEVVEEMVKGALKASGADIAVSISGIAGPGGGSETKPVGTIWLAIGTIDHVQTYLIKASKNRLQNIEYAASVAMNKLRHFVLALKA